ncbi:glycosyltransferase family 2 protein [Micromonospora sp. LAH09]|uniref:glycosyltransferase family 2 protein n=1 Tax=Micromonospora cabrerizensis TaxID=2911213 RepID=UPI001EE7AE41|nr:glycosyltransferase family 2 protein [Micromonospora cabrerizensis]MCG5468188.1 glycosyltransferase family 2 protein [Micromonospora cabrerizensis]
MRQPAATAVVVTHNSERQIVAALTALRQAELPVRLVDNASTDGTVELVRRRFPEVTVLASPTNTGFATAVNRAAAGVDTDVVLLVNPDCVVTPGTVAELVRVIRARGSVGIVGPRLIDAHGRIAISAHRFESLVTVLASRFGGALVPVGLRRLLSGRQRRAAYDACVRGAQPVAVDWLSGACLAVRTDLFVAIGGLDEGYFLYYEDEELCLQAARRGAEVLYVPSVTAVHTGGASSSDPAWIWPHLYRSMLRFFARHRAGTLRAVRGAVLLRALIGIGLAGVRWPVQPRAGRARLRAWARVGRIAITRPETRGGA